MGRKTSAPKAEEYAPGELEKTYAAISKADSDYFAKTYDPLLVEMRDRAAREDVEGTFTGIAGADAMQAMTGNLDLANVRGNISQGADLASGAVSNMLAASTRALDAKRKEQAGVLASARGQETLTGTAIGQAARTSNTQRLNEIQNKQLLRRARRKALFDVAMAAGGSDPVQNALAGSYQGGTTMAGGTTLAPTNNAPAPSTASLSSPIFSLPHFRG